MMRRHGLLTHAFLLLVLSLGLGLAGCDGKDGAPGSDGADGLDGADGADGQACWDLNGNGVGDLPDEDLNGDGVVDVLDCNALASGAYGVAQLHAGYFTDNVYEGTESCLVCHGKLAEEVLTTAHFEWKGVPTNIVNAPGPEHGKVDILNNFCIAIPSNEGRCTQCHTGYGWVDQTFDFEDPRNIDCLVCHDQTNEYAKAKPNGGLPDAAVDLQAVARSVAMGKPTIDNCIDCHAKAGGGNNVKHGDIAMNLANTTKEFDVHMGTDGLDWECTKCHDVKRDGNDKPVSHGIGGMAFHSVDEGNMRDCVDCHGSPATAHANTGNAGLQGITNSHPRLACQVCHIPTFARHTPTKMEWYWNTAGDLERDVEYDPDFEPLKIPIYDKMKGSFVWKKNVRPELRYFNGKWRKALIGNGQDRFASEPAVLAEPVGDHTDPEAMIYPFKKMIGNQPGNPDFEGDKLILVPHLFGTAGGPNAYWGNWNWDLALDDAAKITGQPYTPGSFDPDTWFISTEMYLSVNHEVAPKEQAYGVCQDCHGGDQIDWAGLGWQVGPGGSRDPANGGNRP